jgi:hypothetical protein
VPLEWIAFPVSYPECPMSKSQPEDQLSYHILFLVCVVFVWFSKKMPDIPNWALIFQIGHDHFLTHFYNSPFTDQILIWRRIMWPTESVDKWTTNTYINTAPNSVRAVRAGQCTRVRAWDWHRDGIWRQVLLITSLLLQRCCTGPGSDKSRDIHNLT